MTRRPPFWFIPDNSFEGGLKFQDGHIARTSALLVSSVPGGVLVWELSIPGARLEFSPALDAVGCSL